MKAMLSLVFFTVVLFVSCTGQTLNKRSAKPSDQGESIGDYLTKSSAASEELEIEFGDVFIRVPPDTFTVDYRVKLLRTTKPSTNEIDGVVIGDPESTVVVFDFIDQATGQTLTPSQIQRPVDAVLTRTSGSEDADPAGALIYREGGKPVSFSISPATKVTSTESSESNTYQVYFHAASGEIWLTALPSEFASHKVIGQTDGTSNAYIHLSMRPEHVYAAQDTLYIADSGRARILGWRPIPTTFRPADFVLGQADLFRSAPNNGGVSASSLNAPQGISGFGDKLVVADALNYRVLIWNNLPTSNAEPADIVLGQPDMRTVVMPDDDQPEANKFRPDVGLHARAEALYVTDYERNRLLIWAPFPESSNQAPSAVLGQDDFTAGADPVSSTQKNLSNPRGVTTDSSRLYVSDSASSRILVWNSLVPATGSNADYVIGQSSFTGRAKNAGSPGQGLWFPRGLFHDGQKLFVGDLNHRIVAFNLPNGGTLSNFPTAELVIGQADFTGTTANRGGTPAGREFYQPHGFTFYQDWFFVADYMNRRVLGWNGEDAYLNSNPASIVFGRPDFSTVEGGYNETVSGKQLSNPDSVWTDGSRMVVTDPSNNRILIWSTLSKALANEAADVVVGQPDMDSAKVNHPSTASGLQRPLGAFIAGSRLIVADNLNSRLLIWNQVPTSNGVAPDVVVGQTDFTGTTHRITQDGLRFPSGACVSGSKLIVADTVANRVLIYNSIPTTNGANADVVLGQTSFTGTDINAGGLSASSLNWPAAAACLDNKLLVSDHRNNRVLIWNSIPTTNNQPADVVIGQTDFVSNSGGVGAGKLRSPHGMAVDDSGKLYLSDQGNSRILVFDQIPTTSGVSATRVIGQENFESSVGNLAWGRFQGPQGLAVYDGSLFVADNGNGRIYVRPID